MEGLRLEGNGASELPCLPPGDDWLLLKAEAFLVPLLMLLLLLLKLRMFKAILTFLKLILI